MTPQTEQEDRRRGLEAAARDVYFGKRQELGVCEAVEIVLPSAGVFEPDWNSFFGSDAV